MSFERHASAGLCYEYFCMDEQRTKKIQCDTLTDLKMFIGWFDLFHDLGPGLQSFFKVKVTLTLKEVILRLDNKR